MAAQGQPLSHRIFIERLVIAIAILAVAAFVWALRELLILVFGAVLVAVILSMIAHPIRSRLGLPQWAALLAAVLIVLALFGLAFWLFGAETSRQAAGLRATIPEAWAALQARLEPLGLAEPMRQWVAGLQGAGGGVLSNVGRVGPTQRSSIPPVPNVILVRPGRTHPWPISDAC